jgi:hypothetical protein
MSNNDDNSVNLGWWDSTQSAYVTVARLTHNKYTAGYNDGWGEARTKVDIPTTASTANSYIYVKVPAETVDAQQSNTYAMSNNDDNSVNLGWWDSTQSAYVTVARLTHNKYDAGWGAARGEVDIPTTASTANSYIYVKVPGDTVGAQLSNTYAMSNNDDNSVNLAWWDSEQSAYVTVARLTHNKYDAGWGAARSKVDLPTTEQTANAYVYVKVPGDTVSAQLQYTYTMVNNGNNAVDLWYWDSEHTSYITVARISHNKYTAGYNAGWGAARAKVDIPVSSSTAYSYIYVKVPGDTVDAQVSNTYAMANNDDNSVNLRWWDSTQSAYVTVARLTHGKFDAGWGAARSKVDLPMTEQTANTYVYVKVPGDTVTAQLQYTYTLVNNGNNNVDLWYWDSEQTSYVTVARISHNKYTAGYNAGWGAAYAEVDIPKTRQTANSYIYVKVPGSTVGAQVSNTYAMDTYNNNSVDLKWWNSETSAYVTVARFSHNKYNDGWAAARAEVDIPTTQATANSYIYVKVPGDTVGAQLSNTYAMTNRNNNSVDLQWWDNAHSEYVTVARLTHGKYNDGWGDAYAQVDTPEASTEQTMTIKVPKSSPSQTPQYSELNYVPDSDANYCYIKNGSIVMARKAQYFNRAINWTISITTTSSNVKYTLTHTFNHGDEPGWTDGGNKTLYYHV